MTAYVDRHADAIGESPDAAWARALNLLENSASQLASVPIEEIPTSALGDDLLRLRQVTRMLEAAAASAGRRFAACDEWARDGARTPHAWLQGHGNEGYLAARTLVERGRFIEAFPHVQAAWRGGELSGQHIDVLRRLYRKHPRLHSALLAVDEAIAVTARQCDPAEFLQRLRELCHRADPDAVDDADREERRLTYFHASTLLDGFVHVAGVLDPVLGAALMSALESARRTISDAPSTPSDQPDQPDASAPSDAPCAQQDEREQGEPDAFGPHLSERPQPDIADSRRPIGQANLDALRRILDAAASATGDLALPLITGERPTINVTIPLEGLTEADPTVMGWLERFGLPSGAVSARLTEHLACDASVRPLVIDRAGQLVAMLPKSRIIHPALRRAVFMRDVRCRFPGCRQRIDEVHHIIYHSRGGPTTLRNLVGLCWFHHHSVHDLGWLIEGDPGGRLTFCSPTNCSPVNGSPMERRATSDPPGARCRG